MELYEFHHLIVEGMGPDRSGFLSAFFALVGTHGLHVTSGLIWMAVLMFRGIPSRPDQHKPYPYHVPEPVLALPRTWCGFACSLLSI